MPQPGPPTLGIELPSDLELGGGAAAAGGCGASGCWQGGHPQGLTDSTSHPDQPQVCKELVDLQIKNQRSQEQHDAEIFELKSEVGNDVCPGVASRGHVGGAVVPL